MSDVDERDSDLTPLADFMGGGLKVWPPEQLQPWMRLVRREVPKSATGLAKSLAGRRRYLVPACADAPAFYESIRALALQGAGPRICPTCNGARYVRRERPPGHFLFGVAVRCPACSPAKEGDA